MQGAVGGFENLALDVGLDRFEFAFIENAFANEEQAELGNRVATHFVFALFIAAVKLFVIGKRVRVRPRDVGVYERRTFAFAAVRGSAAESSVAFKGIRAVAFLDVQPGIIRD